MLRQLLIRSFDMEIANATSRHVIFVRGSLSWGILDALQAMDAMMFSNDFSQTFGIGVMRRHAGTENLCNCSFKLGLQSCTAIYGGHAFSEASLEKA